MTTLRLVVVVVALAIPHAAIGQPLRGYALGQAGVGSLSDDEGGLGSGAVYGGAIGWFLTERVALELAVARAHHEREGSLSWNGRPDTALARALYIFNDPDSRVRFFGVGGIGYFRYPGRFTETVYDNLMAAPRLVSQDWLVSGSAIQLGGGLEIGLGDRFIIRPELGLTIARPGRVRPAPEPPYTLPQFMLSGGVRL